MIRLLSILLAALLLSACGSNPHPESTPPPESSALESSLPEESGSEPESVPPASSEPSAESSEEASEPARPEDAFAPARTLSVEYDLLVPAVLDIGAEPVRTHGDPNLPFYTVQKDGKWGLIRDTGEEILPCESDRPTNLCWAGHWMWSSMDSYENFDSWSSLLEEETGYPLCPGHGAGGFSFFAEAEGEIPRIQSYTEGPAEPSEFEEARTFGDPFFPVQYGTLTKDEFDGFSLTGDLYWNFSDKTGALLVPGEHFDEVSWFSGEKAAPVRKGEKWAYISDSGEFLTDFVYESCWGSDYRLNPDTQNYDLIEPCFPFPLWEGLTVVKREGKWGVLDKNGLEVIPCQYEAGAPYPGGAWLKQNGQWILYLPKN